MPILDLPPNPSRTPGNNVDTTSEADGAQQEGREPIKVRTGRYGELEEHELIHLIDSLDDERSRSRFRESIYISIIFYLALAWFLFYGPRVLFHQPEYQDPIALMKQHDKELTFLTPHNLPAPKPPSHPVIDRKTMQQLQQQARTAAPTPQPAPPQSQLQPEQPHPETPAQNATPLPSAPKPPVESAALPSAPRPNFGQSSPSAHDAMQNAMRGGRGGAEYGGAPASSGGPLQSGAQILSDTMGVDFTAYIRRVVSDTKRNWIPLLPEEIQPPLSKKGITVIRFTIQPDGNISAMTLEGPSGDRSLDLAAWNGIRSEGQFPPLPKAFHGPNLELRFAFYCNEAPPQ